jgi:hypothetical protein
MTIWNFTDSWSKHYTDRRGRAFGDEGEIRGVLYYDSERLLLKRYAYDAEGYHVWTIDRRTGERKPKVITERRKITILFLDESG